MRKFKKEIKNSIDEYENLVIEQQEMIQKLRRELEIERSQRCDKVMEILGQEFLIDNLKVRINKLVDMFWSLLTEEQKSKIDGRKDDFKEHFIRPLTENNLKFFD